MEKVYPIIFTLPDLVYGDGFVAGVVTRGRLVMEQDGEDWWCYGVQPGALAASGTTPAEAYTAFRTALSSVYYDYATEARGIKNYRTTVEAFFNQIDESERARWDVAVEVFRKGKALDAPFNEMPKVPADTENFVKVESLADAHSVTPGNNVLPECALPEAA
jgi:hypothetical protein